MSNYNVIIIIPNFYHNNSYRGCLWSFNQRFLENNPSGLLTCWLGQFTVKFNVNFMRIIFYKPTYKLILFKTKIPNQSLTELKLSYFCLVIHPWLCTQKVQNGFCKWDFKQIFDWIKQTSTTSYFWLLWNQCKFSQKWDYILIFCLIWNKYIFVLCWTSYM